MSTKGKKRDSSKSKDAAANHYTTPPKTKENQKSKLKESLSPKSAKETLFKAKENMSPKSKENTSPKSKENTLNLKENATAMKEYVRENTTVSKESMILNDSLSNESHVTVQSVKEPESRPKTLISETVSTTKSDVTSLCQYISENESFGLKPLRK